MGQEAFSLTWVRCFSEMAMERSWWKLGNPLTCKEPFPFRMTSLVKLLIRLAFFIIVILLLLFVWFKFLKPTEPVVTTVIQQTTILEEITSMGKLELVKFQFKDVVEYQKKATTYETLNKFLPTAKAILIVSGEAVGCLDLTQLKEKDIISQEHVITILMPAPELCQHKIDLQKSKVYDISNGYFVEEGQIVQEAYQAAERQIGQSAMKSGILLQTKANAQKVLKPILEKISGKKVVLQWPADLSTKK
jgi:hypothetical protein